MCYMLSDFKWRSKRPRRLSNDPYERFSSTQCGASATNIFHRMFSRPLTRPFGTLHHFSQSSKPMLLYPNFSHFWVCPLSLKQMINKSVRACLLLSPTVFYMSPEEHKTSGRYKTAAFSDKFWIWKLGRNRSCWFVFGWTQGKNERESKHGNKKIAFFTLENVWFQRKIYPSDVNTMTYASFHNIVRNLVGTSMLNFHPIFAKK